MLKFFPAQGAGVGERSSQVQSQRSFSITIHAVCSHPPTTEVDSLTIDLSLNLFLKHFCPKKLFYSNFNLIAVFSTSGTWFQLCRLPT